MASAPNRRTLFVSLGALAITFAAPAWGRDARGFDATWAGVVNGQTAQIIIVGTSVIGVYWRDNYLDVQAANVSADGRSLSFRWRGGSATMTLDGKNAAHIDIVEPGAPPARVQLRPD